MALNSQYARVYADTATRVWLAKKGTTLPTDLSAPTGMVDVGWLGEDGIKMTVDKDIQDFNGLQGGGLIRRKVSKVTKKFTLVLAEDNAVARYIANSGNLPTISGTAPNQIATVSIIDNQTKTLEMACVIDLVDDKYTDRYVFSALDLTFMGDMTLGKGDELRVINVEAAVIAGSVANNITNSPGVIGMATEVAAFNAA